MGGWVLGMTRKLPDYCNCFTVKKLSETTIIIIMHRLNTNVYFQTNCSIKMCIENCTQMLQCGKITNYLNDYLYNLCFNYCQLQTLSLALRKHNVM